MFKIITYGHRTTSALYHLILVCPSPSYRNIYISSPLLNLTLILSTISSSLVCIFLKVKALWRGPSICPTFDIETSRLVSSRRWIQVSWGWKENRLIDASSRVREKSFDKSNQSVIVSAWLQVGRQNDCVLECERGTSARDKERERERERERELRENEKREERYSNFGTLVSPEILNVQ